MKRESSNSKICAITDNSVISKLTSEAEFCCSKCGAKAHDSSSLCSPVSLAGSK